MKISQLLEIIVVHVEIKSLTWWWLTVLTAGRLPMRTLGHIRGRLYNNSYCKGLAFKFKSTAHFLANGFCNKPLTIHSQWRIAYFILHLPLGALSPRVSCSKRNMPFRVTSMYTHMHTHMHMYKTQHTHTHLP